MVPVSVGGEAVGGRRHRPVDHVFSPPPLYVYRPTESPLAKSKCPAVGERLAVPQLQRYARPHAVASHPRRS